MKVYKSWLVSSALVFSLSSNLALSQTVIKEDTILQENQTASIIFGADDITLDCNGFSINGAPIPPFAGISIDSRSGVVVKNCEVNGFFFGINATNASSVNIIDTTVSGAATFGLQALDGTHVNLSGDFVARNNGAAAILTTNKVSITVNSANVLMEENNSGMSLGLNSSFFVSALPPSAPSEIIAQNNDSFGFTIVSGSEFFVFGSGAVIARGNGSNGFSVFSNSTFELANGASLITQDNGANGLLVENSLVNMFDLGPFPGSRIEAVNNQLAGLSFAKSSAFDMGDDSTMTSTDNAIGLSVDDGSSVNVQQSLIEDNSTNVQMTFGSRGTFTDNTIDSFLLSCDKTVIVRGDERCSLFLLNRNYKSLAK